MKRKISFILAFVLAVSALASGCAKVNEDIPTAEASSAVSETTYRETAAAGTLYAYDENENDEIADEEASDNDIFDEDSFTSIDGQSLAVTAPTGSYNLSAKTTSSKATSSKTTTTTKTKWTETEISEVMYVSKTCYAKSAPGGSSAKKVATLKKGKKVNVVAATDNGYYKLADGSYVYAKYLSETKVSTSTSTSTSTSSTSNTTTSTSSTTTTTTTTTNSKSLVEPSYKVDYTKRYGYKSLTADEKIFYKSLYKAISTHSSSVTVPNGLMLENIQRVYKMVFNQEPELFWMSKNIPMGYGTLELTYDYSASEIKDIQAEINKNVDAILAKADGKSTFDKLKVIYDWIVLNHNFGKSENTATCGIRNGLTTGTELQCGGYAKTVLYLCDLMGIECMTVSGFTPVGDSHAWNVVYCEDGYYNFDTTWGDPVNKHDEKYIRYNFFLNSDNEIKDSHLKANQYIRGNGTSFTIFTPPACTKTTYNYFKVNKKEFSSLSDAKTALYAELDNALANKINVAEIKVTDSATYDALLTDSFAKELQTYAKSKGASKLARQTTYNKGVLVVQYDIFY